MWNLNFKINEFNVRMKWITYYFAETTILRLQKRTHRYCTVIACPTSYKQKSPTPPNLCHKVFDSSQHDLIGLKVDTSPHRIHDGLWLLKNLLLHKWAVASCIETESLKQFILKDDKSTWSFYIIIHILSFFN